VKGLEAEGLKPKFHQLDIADKQSVLKLRDFMKEKYGGIDVLVNNAAIAFKQAATESFGVQATVTLKTNYWDTKAACEILFPVLKPGARVVNVSSSAGFLKNLERSENPAKAQELMKKLSSDDLSVAELDAMMKDFDESANGGNHGAHGWISSTYAVSKIGLSALSRIQHRELSRDTSRPDIVLNHIHPGYVDTDMTSHKGVLTIDRGAESSIYSALLPPATPIAGQYIWDNCQVVDWVNGPKPSAI
jgi:carbonyl reductase 1